MLTSSKTITIEVFDDEDKTKYTALITDNTIKRITVLHSNNGSAYTSSFHSLPIEVQAEVISHL